MFRIKQYLKMFLQNILLPLFYRFYARKPVRKGSVIFADAHHEEIPFSMRRMYEAVMVGDADFLQGDTTVFDRTGEITEEGSQLSVQVFVRDFGKMGYLNLMRYLIRFMKQYATAEYVFICDYYLPVASCRKRSETAVVQLWHSCGLMKKIAYDTGEDIPTGYRGNMFGNYTWLTLSSEECVPVHARALQIPASRIRATGVSRTDYYFDEDWNKRCKENFFEKYPETQGKKIALWAPTFRGNAAHPVLQGLEAVREAEKECPEDWYFVIKAHPHVDAHGQVSNCTIPTEELLCVADVLITDYSSVLFDYLIYEKPVILFAPDLEEYEQDRGFYIDYRSLPFPLIEKKDSEALLQAVEDSGRDYEGYKTRLRQWKEKYTGACDGHATERILKLLHETEIASERNKKE